MQQPPAGGAPCGPACTTVYTGTLDGLRKIARREGLGTLWRGTDVALMMAIPMVGIYLPLYDYLLQQMKQLSSNAALGGGGGADTWAPLAAGALARSAAVYATAPFELVRTRLQATAAAPAPAHAAALAGAGADCGPGRRAATLLQHVPAGGGGGSAGRLRAAGRMWTGVGATLARDVPFSALYWGLVEPIRGALLPHAGSHPSEWQVFTANVTGEPIAGGMAQPCTTRAGPPGWPALVMHAFPSAWPGWARHSPASHLLTAETWTQRVVYLQPARWRAAWPAPSPRPLTC